MLCTLFFLSVALNVQLVDHAPVLSVLLKAMLNPGRTEVKILYVRRGSGTMDIEPRIVKPVEWTNSGTCVMFIAWHASVKKRFHVEDVVSAEFLQEDD